MDVTVPEHYPQDEQRRSGEFTHVVTARSVDEPCMLRVSLARSYDLLFAALPIAPFGGQALPLADCKASPAPARCVLLCDRAREERSGVLLA